MKSEEKVQVHVLLAPSVADHLILMVYRLSNAEVLASPKPFESTGPCELLVALQ